MNRKLESDEIWLELIDRWKSEEQQILTPQFSLDNEIIPPADSSKSQSPFLRVASLGGVVLVISILTNLFISPDVVVRNPFVIEAENNDLWSPPNSPCSESSSCLNRNNYMER